MDSLRKRSVKLGRWLGPWADPEAAPSNILRRAQRVPALGDARPMDIWFYRPVRPPSGTLLISPGLHYLGPADPRLDRLCRVLASTGTLVACPFLPDFCLQNVGPALASDEDRALDALLEQPDYPGGPVGLFSISFGSRPALEVAATRPEIGALMLFGGFADWVDTVWFCTTGKYRGCEGRRQYDPLNRPVVFRILTPYFEGLPPDELAAVSEAWFEQVRRTWGRVELKEPGALAPIANEVADSLRGDARRLFLQGCGLEPGGDELVARALERAGDAFDYLVPDPWAAQIRVPTIVAHGQDDDVIPFEHAERLHQMIPGAARHVTGAYSHTGQTPLRDLAPKALSEGRAVVGLLNSLALVTHPGLTSRSG